MILECGQWIYHPFFGPGVVRHITRTHDPGYDLDRHRVEFAGGIYRDIIGTQRLCSPEEGARLYPTFGPGDAVHHHRFGYGTIAESRVSPDSNARLQHTIDFDRGMGRHVIVASPGMLCSASGLAHQRRLGIRPPAPSAASRMSPAARRECFANRHGLPAHVQAMRRSARFDLYREWLYRYVAAPNGCLYARLDPADSPVVWRFIEQLYLDRYELLLRICSVPGCDGVWPIDYPGGGLRTDRSIEFADYDVPESLIEAFYEWSCRKEEAEFNYSHDGGPQPDFDAIDAQGLALAGRLKAFVGARVYVEIDPFVEIIRVEGETVEAEMPAIIADCGY